MQCNIVLKIGNRLCLIQCLDEDYQSVKDAIRKAEDIEELWDLIDDIDYMLTDYIEIIEF